MDQNIEKIREKIIKDAESRAKEINDSAQEQVDQIIEDNKKSMESYEKDYRKQTDSLVETYKHKVLAQERLAVKKDVLQKREELIEHMFDETVKNVDRKSRDYQTFLKKAISSSLPLLGKKITVECSKSDSAVIKKLIGSKKQVTIKNTEIKGGMIFEDEEGKKIDESLDAQFERKRSDIRFAISQKLGA